MASPEADGEVPPAGPVSRSAVGRITGPLSRRAGTSTGVRATCRFLRRQLWAWPAIAAVLLGGVGWAVHRAVEDAMREQRTADLNGIADATVNAVRTWAGEQLNNVELIATDEPTQQPAAELAPLADGNPVAERKPVQDALRARLRKRPETAGYVGCLVVTPDGVVAAADQDPPVGKVLAGYRREVFDRAIRGERLVSRPFRSPLLLADHTGAVRANLPTMFAAGPLRDETGRTVAAIGLRVRPEDWFTQLLEPTGVRGAGGGARDRAGPPGRQAGGRFPHPLGGAWPTS